MSTDGRQQAARGSALGLKKKRPTPEGAGLPGVVSSNIVNWEGNYILDTNTFNIVPVPPIPLVFSHREQRIGVRKSTLPHDLEVEVGPCCVARVANLAYHVSRIHPLIHSNTND